MNTVVIRNACYALAVVGALSLAACRTTDDTMEAPEPQPAPAAEESMTEPMTAPPTEEPMDEPTEEVPATP